MSPPTRHNAAFGIDKEPLLPQWRARFVLKAFLDIFRSPFGPKTDVPKVTFVPTAENQHIVDSCKSLKVFKPLWWAKGPHIQTLLQASHPVAVTSPGSDLHTVVILKDGVQIELEWKGIHLGIHAPLVVCLHGLGGDANSRYMQVFTQECVRLGYRTVVYCRRGHGFSTIAPLVPGSDDAPIFPKHVNLEDMDQVVEHIQTRLPYAPKYLVGFSCGGNLAINYIAKRANTHPFLATVSIGNGFDLWTGTNLLMSNPTEMRVATEYILEVVRRRKTEITELSNDPTLVPRVLRCSTIQEVENLLVVPGQYSSLYEYYEDCSSHNKLDQVQSPLLCIGNAGDPLIRPELCSIPQAAAQKNSNIINVETRLGGHLGWIEKRNKIPWYMKLIFEYLAEH
jgi:hypothetical protein